MVNQLDLPVAHCRQSTFIVAIKGKWDVGLFRNEGNADPYVVAQATSLFMLEIPPNLVVLTIQVFCLGVQSHSFQPWVD